MNGDAATGIPALDFMLGEWELDYTVTERGSVTRPLCGTGSIRRLFDTAYVTFDYRTWQRETREKTAGAHAIIAWDGKERRYRLFWFESSGAFQQAAGTLSDERTLALEWQGIDCTQIFRRLDDRTMYLEMRCPGRDLVMRVDFTRVGDEGR